MRVLRDHTTIAPLLDELVLAGYLVWQPAPAAGAPGCWKLAEGSSPNGYLHRDANRYFGADVSGMLPLYQEMYGRIFAERLATWGLAANEDAGVLCLEGLILFWGPDTLMRAKQPAAVALRHVERADESWVDWLEQRWHQAAADLEDQIDRFWADLCRGHTTPVALRSLVSGKVTLAAIGVDALIPPTKLVESWLSPYMDSSLLADVVEGCYLPACGYLAYDILEIECWRLANSFQSLGYLSEEARRQFIRRGLFFLYNALNTDRKMYFFHQYPLETAITYGRAARGREEIAARMEEVRQRNWRRRYHNEWARQQIEAISTNSYARQRLLVLHRLLGIARDFDEEKRRLNMKLWRALFALADGLGVSLTQPQAVLQHLCDVVDRHGGHVVIDPVFIMPAADS